VCRLTCALPRAGAGRLSVLDLRGREVVAVPVKASAPGEQAVALPLGSRTPGVYFVRLVFDSGAAVAKLVLLP
jgi:hypothetical protein